MDGNDKTKKKAQAVTPAADLPAKVGFQLPSKAVLNTTLFDMASDVLKQRSQLTHENQNSDSVFRELNRIMGQNGYPAAHLEDKARISDKNLPGAWNDVSHGQTFLIYGSGANESQKQDTATEAKAVSPEDAQNRLRRAIVDRTSTLPLLPGEGYYQVLKRMHSDAPAEKLAQEAHRIKTINHDRDILRVGERLATATDAERQRQYEQLLAKGDKKSAPGAPSHSGTFPPGPGDKPAQPGVTKPSPALPKRGEVPPLAQPPSAPEDPAPHPPSAAALSMDSAYAALKTNFDKTQADWSKGTQSQGLIGRTFDAAKNHIGTSGDGKAWYDPRRLWSGIFNSDVGSAAIQQNLKQEGQQLEHLKQAAASKDLATFRADYMQLTGTNFNQSTIEVAPLKGDRLVQAYDDSQRSGVDTTTDIAAGIAAVASLRFKGAGVIGTMTKTTLAGAMIGGTTKAALMEADGKYANLPRDFAMGSVMGGTVPLSELAGSRASRLAAKKMDLTITGDLLRARIETQGAGLRTRILSAGLKSGTAGAVFGALESPSHEVVTDIEKHQAVKPLSLVELSLKGAALGFVGGTALGGVSDRLVDSYHVAFPGKIVMPNSKIGGIEIPTSGAIKLEDASKILKIKPEELLEKAKTDPFGAVQDAVKLYEKTGVNIQKVDPITGQPSVPAQFSEALTTVQNVEMLTAETGVKLGKKVEIVQATDTFLKNNPTAVEDPLKRVVSDRNYQEVVRLKRRGESGTADAFEQQFKQDFEKDLKTTMAVRRVENSSLSEADALAQSVKETEAAYKQKAADFFKDMTDPAQRQRLNTLVDEIYDKFNPEVVTKQQLSTVLENVPKKDRPLAVAILQESAGSSSDSAVTARFKSLKSDIQTKLGTSSPADVYTLAPNSSGNLIGYLYRKSNSTSMAINNIDALAARIATGQTPQTVLLFDDIAATKITPEMREVLKKIPKVYVADLGAFEKGINVLDYAKGPQAVEAKLATLLAEAKHVQGGNTKLLPTGVARQVLSGSVDDAAKAIGSNVEVIRPTGNPIVTSAAAVTKSGSTLDQLYTQINVSKSSKEQIANFLSQYAGEQRELAARMLADGAVHNSFPVMIKKAIALHDELNTTLQSKGLSMKDVVMVSDKDPGGSTHLVTYLFGNANGLSAPNFVSSIELQKMVTSGAARDKVLAYFDDTIYSGSQTAGMLDGNVSSLSPFKRVVVAGLGAYEKGINRIKQTHLAQIGKVDVAAPTTHQPFYSDKNPFYSQLPANQKNMVKTIGGSDGFGTVQGSLIWPYMYPDNNIEFFGSQFSGNVLHLPGP